MAKVDESCIIRYKKGNDEVEALVEYKSLVSYLENKDSQLDDNFSIYDVFADTKIYSDSNKGLVADNETLKHLFANLGEEDMLYEIANKGDPQIPTSYLNELREKKKNQIINYITNETINPQTKRNYSSAAIEEEFEKLKISINPYQNHIHQAEIVFKKLKEKLPIKFDLTTLIIQVPSQYAGKFNNPMRSYGTIQKQFYDEHGSMHMHVQVPTGRLEEVEKFIKDTSKNSASYHVSQE